MTDAAIVADELEPAAHVPGYCRDHPNVRLVTHRRAGVRWWYSLPRADPPTVCTSPDHDPYTRERCGWCGLSLDGQDGDTAARFSPKRAYCRRRGDMCRIDAHRARRRGRRFAPAPIGGL